MELPERFEYSDKVTYLKNRFTIPNEDSTLGNLLRYELQKSSKVDFVGYRQPHILNPILLVDIHTKESTTPEIEYRKAIDSLDILFEKLSSYF